MQKLYYSISEVSEILDEEQHILRYWEKEFVQIKPRKNRAGNRIYSRRDLEIVKTAKRLLRDEKLSLKGAKDRIDKMDKAGEFASSGSRETSSREIPSESHGIAAGESVHGEHANQIHLNREDAEGLYTSLKELMEFLR